VGQAGCLRPLRGAALGVEAVQALAKLTLSLRVVRRRPDGMHLLDAEMVTVDLADTLQFSEGGGSGVDVTGVAADGVPLGEDNLIVRALTAVGRRDQVRVRVVKRIPAGAGLGGGSADAAAVLRWAGCRNLVVAARLGADVPFCLVGGRARVTGIGEEVSPLPFGPVAGRAFTLLTPPFAVSTVAVYQEFDALGGSAVGGGLNDLEPAALVVEPRLAEWRDRLAAATGRVPVLAGSGSTWFVEGAYPGEGRTVARAATP
jgi:4-diphosphocytidyl-2-C-methyl-D-erythritol kinase